MDFLLYDVPIFFICIFHVFYFSSGSKTGDYHDDMNHANFMKWVEIQLLPHLPERSVLVIDNAPYHNVKVAPNITSANKKADMLRWLEYRNIEYDEHMTKVELYSIIKDEQSKEQVQYKLDELLEAHGHSVLRLPPYHPELNPIEKMWATLKKWVASRNVTFKLQDVEALAREKFAAITVEEWQAICGHVQKIENQFIETEHLLDAADDSLQFTVNTGSSDESVSEEYSEGELSGVEVLETSDSD